MLYGSVQFGPHRTIEMVDHGKEPGTTHKEGPNGVKEVSKPQPLTQPACRNTYNDRSDGFLL